MLWCRKCRRFSKTFFVEGERGCSPESAKHRTSLGKSTDVLPQNYGCFHRKSPMFLFSGKRAKPNLLQAMPSKRQRKTKSREADGGRCLDYLRARYPALIFRFSKRFAGQRQHEMLTGNEYTHKQHKRRHSEGGIGSALILPRQCHCRGKFLQKAEEHSWHF